MEKDYIEKCKNKEIKPVDLWILETTNPIIGNMATKDDFKLLSKLEWITKGIENLRSEIISRKLKFVVIPKIGAALGHLDWDPVETEILKLYDLDSEIVIAKDFIAGPKESKMLECLFDLAHKCCLNEKNYKNLIDLALK